MDLYLNKCKQCIYRGLRRFFGYSKSANSGRYKESRLIKNILFVCLEYIEYNTGAIQCPEIDTKLNLY